MHGFSARPRAPVLGKCDGLKRQLRERCHLLKATQPTMAELGFRAKCAPLVTCFCESRVAVG